MGTRSVNGCWTCKLRRKKCDEKHPACVTCENLGIVCHGYGPKPRWMDRGPLERQAAEKVKIEVARTGHKKSKQRWRATSVASTHQDTTQNDTARFESNPSRHTENNPSSLPTPSEDNFATDLMSWQNPTPPDTDEFGEFTLSSLPVCSPSDFDLDCFSLSENTCDNLEQGAELGISGAFVNPELEMLGRTEIRQVEGAHRAKREAVTSHERFSSIDSGFYDHPSMHEKSNTRGGTNSPEDALLLSRFMSRDFPTQFRFDPVQGSTTAQWLQFILISSKSVQQIARVVSRVCLDSTHSSSRNEVQRDYEKNFANVESILKSLPSSMASLSILNHDRRTMQVIETCTCLVQAIQLEIYCGISHRSESYLSAVSPYMRTLIDLAVSRRNEDSSQRSQLKDSIHDLYTASAKALLERLLWLDLMISISTGRGTFLETDFAPLLESNNIDMIETSGCRNDVVKALFQAVSLSRWRKQREEEKRLNYIELGTRGSTIIHSIKSLISGVTNSRHSTSDNTEQASLFQQQDSQSTRDTTLIFAHAALVYVHVIVSGPHPDLEDIQNGTAELVKLFRTPLDSKALEHALWPLCIAACFTADEEVQFLSETIKSLGQRSQRFHLQTWTNLLDIGLECRRLRTQEERNCCWVQTMERLQRQMLLV